MIVILQGDALATNSLRLERMADRRIELSWTPPNPDVLFGPPRVYRVLRRTGSEVPYILLAETYDLSYVDSTMQPDALFECDVMPLW